VRVRIHFSCEENASYSRAVWKLYPYIRRVARAAANLLEVECSEEARAVIPDVLSLPGVLKVEVE